MLRYLSRRPWFTRSLDLNNKAKLQLLRLEDRVVPATTITDFDAVGLVGKTVSIKVTHNQGSGDVEGRIDWKDGTTTEFTGWSYTTSAKTFTHTYSTTGTYVIESEAKGGSVDDSESCVVYADVAPAYAVDALASMESSAFATSSGNNPKNTSTGMVRYADGVIDLHFPDLESTGFGMPFGITRSWSNGPGYDSGTDLGPGWNINQLPTIMQVDGTTTLSVVIDGNEARTFDLTTTANTYRERFFGQHKLVRDTGAGLYVLTTPGGVVYKFKDFTASDVPARGTFDSRTDANGNVIAVYSRSSGQITEIRRDDGVNDYESWLFTYSSDKIASITLRRGPNTSSYTNYRKVEYTYYSNESHGNNGDLKLAVIKDGSNNVISKQYMRYFVPGEANGFAGALKMYVGLASYERADNTLADPLTASDGDLDDYADLVFQFDSSRRVTLQKVQGLGCSMCSAGVGEYTFSYTASSHGAPVGVNRWAMKTTETLPDGNQNIVYSNGHGQVMQFVQKDGSSYWRTHYVYDGLGKLVQKSNPSATTNINESYPELVITNDVRLGIDTEFVANSSTTYGQVWPAIASDWQGNYVVTWTYVQTYPYYEAIYARKFNAAGQPLTGDILVDTSTTNWVGRSQIAMDRDGDFVVVWHEYYGSDTDGYGINARRFNAAGEAQGSVFQVNTHTTGNQTNPDVAMDETGNFVVTWESDGQDGSGVGIYAQRYNNGGTAQGSEFRVNSHTTNGQAEPVIAMDVDGDFVVVWTSTSQDGSNGGIYGQRFNASGTAQGSEFRVNTTTTNHQGEPAVAMNHAGAFVVGWTSDNGAAHEDVFVQRYNSSGTAQGSETRVNSHTTYDQYLSTIASDASGNFVVAWTNYGEDGSWTGVYAKHFLADGTAGSQFRLNDSTTYHQYHQAIASDYDGNFVIAWDSWSTYLPDAVGIYVRPLERTYSYITDTTGYVERYHYGRVTTAGSDTTTGTGSAGDIAGFLKGAYIVQGEIDGGGNTLIKQNALTYFLHSNGTNTVSPLATSTAYRDTNSGGQTTTMGYTWASSSLKLTEVTIMHPMVSTAQNGPNSAVTEYSRVDSYGRVTWTKDGDARLTYRDYDDATGAVKKFINDVNTSQTTTFTGTAPWSSAGNELHLTSSTTVDFMGRPTKQVDANGNSTYLFYNDPNHETRVYPGWSTTSQTTTGPTQVYREDWAKAYIEMLTMTATPNTSASIPLGTETIGSVKSLSRVILNNAGQKIEFHDYFQLSDVTYSASSVTLTGPSSAVRHYATKVDYAARGGIKRHETPNGTITRYQRDALGRVNEVWIGTDDTPTTSYWPNVTTGTDLVKVYTYTYDSGTVGDGNLTKVSADPGAAADRETLYFYDWRNRPVAVKMGYESSETATLNRPIYTFAYDNLNQITSTKQYDGDAVTITISNALPTLSGSPAVQSRMDTAYDEMGRAYRETIFSGSSESVSLTTNTWFDKRGNVIKTLQPGGLVTKLVHDGAGRMKSIFFTDGGSDPAPGATSNWDHADDVIGDVVYEELHYSFDSNGNVTQTTRKERQPTASGTAELNDHDTQPYARVSYIGNYYDKANRLTDTVDVGTNGDATWAVPGSVPSRSDTALVTSFGYDSAGDVTITTDPRGIETRNTYDALHRLTQMIEGYDDGTPSGTNDRKTTLEYDGSHHVTKRTLWLDASEREETQYVYGVDVGVDGNELSSNDLLGVILYPDPEDGYPVTPFPAQYQYSYNRVGDVIRMEDINETVHEYGFDVVGRQLTDAITSYNSKLLDDTVLRVQTAFDAAGRAYLFTNYDAASSGTIVSQVEREFNGYGQITKEYQEFVGAKDGGTLYVQYGYSSSGNKSLLETLTYPSGEVLEFSYDAIGRATSQDFEASEVEAVSRLGLGRIIGSDVGDGTLIETLTLDRFGRVTGLKWEDDSPTEVEHFTYGYDRNSNVLYRVNVLNHDFDELYQADAGGGYDKLNQMTRYARGVLTDTEPNGVPDTITSPTLEKEYARDGVGNVTSITTDGGTPLAREFNRQNRLTDHGTDTLGFDAVGNLLVDDQGNDYKYDAWNRLVGFNEETDRYAYDAMNRRTKVGDRRLYHAMDGSVIEEHDGDGLRYQHTWSLRGKHHALARFDYTGESFVVLYAITDIYGTVTAITNVTGIVVERFAYDAHGNFEVLDGEWRGGFAVSQHDWTTNWGGGRWDEMWLFAKNLFLVPRIQWNSLLIVENSELTQGPQPQSPKTTVWWATCDQVKKSLAEFDKWIAYLEKNIKKVEQHIATEKDTYTKEVDPLQQQLDKLNNYVATTTPGFFTNKNIEAAKKQIKELEAKIAGLKSKHDLRIQAWEYSLNAYRKALQRYEAFKNAAKKVIAQCEAGKSTGGFVPFDPNGIMPIPKDWEPPFAR